MELDWLWWAAIADVENDEEDDTEEWIKKVKKRNVARR